jgi:hypothetical protein
MLLENRDLLPDRFPLFLKPSARFLVPSLESLQRLIRLTQIIFLRDH